MIKIELSLSGVNHRPNEHTTPAIGEGASKYIGTESPNAHFHHLSIFLDLTTLQLSFFAGFFLFSSQIFTHQPMQLLSTSRSH